MGCQGIESMATLKRWVLRRRPVGEIRPGDLELVEEPIRDLADGEVLVRTLYLSLDPPTASG
jgi:NADPH-dependent curcumin reductase CurA